jgi:SPOR domain
VQLLALRSEQAVHKAWTVLQKRHGDLLGGLSLNVQRRDLGAKKGVYYRLRVGPLANLAAARTLCSKFKKRKQGCVVVRR